jgi:2-dehydropantoate 2-reductase
MTQNVLIVGSGALACLFASRLTRGGMSVTLTGTWEPGLSAIRQKGVGLTEGGKLNYFPVDVLDISSQMTGFELAIVLTKAYQTSSALNRVKSRLADDSPVLSLQNGLTPRMRLIEILGESRTISGTTTCAAEQMEPGIVRHNGGESVILGTHPQVDVYRALLLAGGFDVSVVDDIRRMIWEKAIINSAANPLGAILRMKNGDMASLPDVMVVMDELVSEACAVAIADGCSVDESEMRIRLHKILETSSANRCSMLQDVLHNRETEINEINGAILELADRYQIQTPVQRTVTQLVRSIRREEH